jgi:c-di-GMP-binding flagellar brake protein YcgR
MDIRVSALYLLQTYFKEDDPMGAIILVAGIGGVILIALVINLIRHGIGSSGMGGSGSSQVRRFSGFTLRRIAREYGLNRDQIKVLEFVFKHDNVADPERVMANPAVLDKHFKRAYQQIERFTTSDEEAQLQIARLFSTRNAIEFSQNAAANGPPPRITANMTAVLASGGDSYPVRVISSRGDLTTVESPKNALGNTVSISKGARATLSFFTKTSKGFSFEAQVVGADGNTRMPAIQLARAGRPKNLVQRRFRRRHVGINCTLRPIRIEETGSGRKKKIRMITDARRFKGTIQDISIGGCAIKAGGGISAGSRVKIEFDYGNTFGVAVLAQVLRINRSGISTVVHIKFLKVPRKAMNAINAAVFDYYEG